MTLLRVSEIQRGVNFPLSRAWAYKAMHLKQHPGLFVKVGTALFVDLEKFRELVESGRV